MQDITLRTIKNIKNKYLALMKKFITFFLILLFQTNINAGLKEAGQSEVPTDIQAQIINQYEKNSKKKKNIGKKYILYFYTDGDRKSVV